MRYRFGGYATVQAVETNEQLTFDFDDLDLDSGVGPATDTGDLLTWFVLFHLDEELVAMLTPSRLVIAVSGWSLP